MRLKSGVKRMHPYRLDEKAMRNRKPDLQRHVPLTRHHRDGPSQWRAATPRVKTRRSLLCVHMYNQMRHEERRPTHCTRQSISRHGNPRCTRQSITTTLDRHGSTFAGSSPPIAARVMPRRKRKHSADRARTGLDNDTLRKLAGCGPRTGLQECS